MIVELFKTMLQSNKNQLCFGIEARRGVVGEGEEEDEEIQNSEKQNIIRGQRRGKGKGGGSKDLFPPTRKWLSVPLAVHECRVSVS